MGSLLPIMPVCLPIATAPTSSPAPLPDGLRIDFPRGGSAAPFHGTINKSPTNQDPTMLDYFTTAINVDFDAMAWIDCRSADNTHWRKSLMQNVYTYLELIEIEPGFESYNY
jgi:hypothetical protein